MGKTGGRQANMGLEEANNYEEYLNQYDFQDDRTVGIFEYTKRAVQRMDQILSSIEFEKRDAETIYRYLTKDTVTIPFYAYLKRYLYLHAGLEGPFEEVEDFVYEEVIRNAFFEHHMTFSFGSTKKRTTAIIRGWLTRESAQRKTVFLLGFGLRMDDKEVTDFLTKALREGDFDFSDPVETVYWYCFHHRLGYASARLLLEEYEKDGESPRACESYLISVSLTPKICLWEESTLREYLRYLKKNHLQGREEAFFAFKNLYDQVGALCDHCGEGTSYGIESTFCCGIPKDSSGNLKSISESTLSGPFLRHKMSRQRMKMLLRKERPVNRFDLITFLFYLYSNKEVLPDQRRDAFILRANEILTGCHMAGLYFANPYEVFVTMCLMTDDPLTTYGDVWELSYRKKDNECPKILS